MNLLAAHKDKLYYAVGNKILEYRVQVGIPQFLKVQEHPHPREATDGATADPPAPWNSIRVADGRLPALVSVDDAGQVLIWLLDYNGEMQTMAIHNGLGSAWSIAVDWRNSYSLWRHVAVGDNTHSVTVFDIRGRDCKRLTEGMDGNVPSLDYSPDGKHLLACSISGKVVIWSVENGLEYPVKYTLKLDGHEWWSCRFTLSNELSTVEYDEEKRRYPTARALARKLGMQSIAENLLAVTQVSEDGFHAGDSLMIILMDKVDMHVHQVTPEGQWLMVNKFPQPVANQDPFPLDKNQLQLPYPQFRDVSRKLPEQHLLMRDGIQLMRYYAERHAQLLRLSFCEPLPHSDNMWVVAEMLGDAAVLKVGTDDGKHCRIQQLSSIPFSVTGYNMVCGMAVTTQEISLARYKWNVYLTYADGTLTCYEVRQPAVAM